MVILLYWSTRHAERLHQFAVNLESPNVILIDSMIFLPPFLDVIRMPMSTVSGLVLLVFDFICWISYRNRCTFYGYNSVFIQSTCWETSSICCFSRRPNCYSGKMHDFSVTIARCYKNVYVNSFWAGVGTELMVCVCSYL